jgi:transcriptional regulator with XRE-family HTH domain
MKKVKKHDWPKNIKKILDSGMTQQDIADKTGVRQGEVSKLLNGEVADILYSRGAALMKLLGRK